MKRAAFFLSLVTGVLVLAGCASGSHPVSMTVEGEEREYRGTMNAGPNIQDVHLQRSDGQVQCKGVSLLGYAAPGCSATGTFRLECTDGREINGDWEMADCITGEGTGRDSSGSAVRFLIGEAVSATARTVPPAPSPDASPGTEDFIFLVGGDLAVGFGEPPAASSSIVFEDSKSGLFILKTRHDPAPMVLAEEPIDAERELFVVIPASKGRSTVRSIALEFDGQELLRIVDDTVESSGLPVIDIHGNVVGVTAKDDAGVTVFDASRIRRYLFVVEPVLAKQPAQVVPAGQLGQRILPDT